MASISNLLNADEDEDALNNKPHTNLNSSSHVLGNNTSNNTSRNITPPGSIGNSPNPISRTCSSVPLKHKRKSTTPSAAVFSDVLRHRLRELPNVVDSDDDSCDVEQQDSQSKSRKRDQASSPRASLDSKSPRKNEDTHSPVLPQFHMMNITQRTSRPASPLSKEHHMPYTSPLTTSTSANRHSGSPLAQSRLFRTSSPLSMSTVTSSSMASALPPLQYSHSQTAFSQLPSDDFGSPRRGSIDLAYDVSALRSQFDIVTAENDRLRDFNRSLLAKIERSYQQLLQSQNRPETLAQKKEQLMENISGLQQQLTQLQEEYEMLCAQLGA